MNALLLLALVGPQAPASFKNILVADSKPQSMGACEPSIAVSQKDTSNVVAGVILDRALTTFDGGKTWTDQKIKSRFGVWGDPTLLSDPQGNFYYFHLSAGPNRDDWIDRIVCQKSTDGGKTWSDGSAIGFNPPKDQDKQWAAIHPTKPNIYVTWTQFDKYGSKAATDFSNIMFSMSADAGQNWSKAVQINQLPGDCLDSDNTTEGAVPAVDKNGQVYVVWSNRGKLFFDTSSDNGRTWLVTDKIIAEQVGGWDINIPGTDRSNGMPVLMIDNSKGPNAGTLYVTWADQRNGENDTDVFFIRSTDKGATWSKPLRVNQDPKGKQQYLPWLAVDQTTGNIYVVYYDRRNHVDVTTDVYLAYSVDGGKSFKEKRISETPFTPTEKAFMGDYTNLSAHGGIIAPIWARMDKGKTTVWTAMIKQKDLVGP